ncbi:hypothetical protein RND81_01G156100 [Saponaria officinalis]|uniref:Uncharacterized protein n=1 Tax=Saponaria officinalis TaxID=3572 RepID=A0AAW1NJ04_SAPOF
MLFAVEGGGLFSASASGYSKGLSLLLLGQKSDEKHMRVSPWNQYQLVDQETQLASEKNRLSRGCASYVCFGRTSAGLDGQSPLKVGPTQQQQDILPGVPSNDRDKEPNAVVDFDINARHISLKSSMKKSTLNNIPQNSVNNDEQELLVEEGSVPEGLVEKRKVQWTDACGKELTEIREFEMRYVIAEGYIFY